MNEQQEQIVREAEEREKIVKRLAPPQVLIPTEMFTGLLAVVREQEKEIEGLNDELGGLEAALEDGD